MHCGGDVPIRPVGNDSYASYAVEECNASSPFNDPYEVARTLTDRTWQSSHNEEYMGLLRELVAGSGPHLLDVMRAVFEIGLSHPFGSGGRWAAVSALFSAFALADQEGKFEAASAIEGYLRDLGYDVHATIELGADDGHPRTVTYQISGNVEPDEEIATPPQDQPPADVHPPARHRPRRPREQVAIEDERPAPEQAPPAEQPPEPAPQPTEQPQVTTDTIMSYFAPYESPYTQGPVTQEDQEARQAEQIAALGTETPDASDDPLSLGYEDTERIFGETLDREREAFLERRRQGRHIDYPDEDRAARPEQDEHAARPIFPGGPIVALCSESGDDTEPVINIPQPFQIPPNDVPPRSECREVAGGFACRMIDPTIADHLSHTGDGPYVSREYAFHREENGDYVYHDADGRNSVVIHPNGRVEYETSRVAVDGLAVSFVPPWEDPNLPVYISTEIADATREIRNQIVERYDRSVTREALDNLKDELAHIIARHTEWTLAQQHNYLFLRWDECRGDSVGREARSIIEEYIRQKYPKSTPLEITEEELVAMNERRVTQSIPFCPYGCQSSQTA